MGCVDLRWRLPNVEHAEIVIYSQWIYVLIADIFIQVKLARWLTSVSKW